MHGIHVSHSYRDARGGHVVVADDGHLDGGVVGDATVTIQPMSIATSKPSNSTKKSRVSAVRSDLMFGTALLIVTLRVLSDDTPITPRGAEARHEPSNAPPRVGTLSARTRSTQTSNLEARSSCSDEPEAAKLASPQEATTDPRSVGLPLELVADR